MMEINVKTFSKAKALEAAFKAVGDDEFAFMSEILPSVDNQCTTNEDADIILEDLQTVYEGYFTFTNQTRKEFVVMIRKLYKCELACQYATLMTFGHSLKPRDVEQIMCGEFANLRDGDWCVELEDTSCMADTQRIFEFIQHGLFDVVREVLCKYALELQKQTSKL